LDQRYRSAAGLERRFVDYSVSGNEYVSLRSVSSPYACAAAQERKLLDENGGIDMGTKDA